MLNEWDFYEFPIGTSGWTMDNIYQDRTHDFTDEFSMALDKARTHSTIWALLDKQQISLEITPEAKTWLANRGFDPKYGARQVAGTIRNYIRRPISKMITSGEISAGDKAVIEVADNSEITYDVKQKYMQ